MTGLYGHSMNEDCLMIRHLLVILSLVVSSFAARASETCHDVFSIKTHEAIQISIEDLNRSKEFLSKIDRKRAVAVLGSARLRKGSSAYDGAYRFGELLGRTNQITVTGGGLGIMEAANAGAKAVGGESYGVIIHLPHEKTNNDYLDAQISHSELFSRMEVLVRSSSAFVFFEGGIGTLQELTHVLSLIQNRQMQKFPVVLVGREYWKPLVQLLEGSLLKGGTISKEDMDLFVIVETPEEAVSVIQSR
jgi:uncharacterized protein (TIGR00730 family)